jgi:hypothetical protein
LCEHVASNYVSIGWSIAGFCGIPPRRPNKGESA